MKIYRVKPDIGNYQYVCVSDLKSLPKNQMGFDCTPRASNWVTPKVHVLEPFYKPPGDFFSLNVMESPAFTEEVCDKLYSHLEMGGEILPLDHEDGFRLWTLNVLTCLNNLNRELSQPRLVSNGIPIGFIKYAFHPDRFTESTIFKIPETRYSEILTVERTGDPDEEFKAAVEHHKFKGLLFECLWEG